MTAARIDMCGVPPNNSMPFLVLCLWPLRLLVRLELRLAWRRVPTSRRPLVQLHRENALGLRPDLPFPRTLPLVAPAGARHRNRRL